MNYPVWDLNSAGGGLLIAMIAVIHVYIAHFAVGGGLLLVLTEIKARRTGSEEALYRSRSGDAGVLCGTCHGSPHAIYPARNPYRANRDVIAPRQYQQSPYPLGSNRNCKVCHTIDMEEEIHHPNMLGEFRNTVE